MIVGVGVPDDPSGKFDLDVKKKKMTEWVINLGYFLFLCSLPTI